MSVKKISGTPEFVATPVEEIPKIVSTLKSTFFSDRTKNVEWRKKQLRKLYWAIKDNEDLIADALLKDIGKAKQEALLTEIYWCENEILYILEKLDEVLKEEKGEVKPMYALMRPKIRKEPMGTVLIISPFNFPFQLAISPAIGAIAAGNTLVIKPSEVTPHTAAVLAALVDQYLDRDTIRIVNGAIPETTALLNEQWDKIMYTGNGHVARIVQQAAAKHLTPTILELGGKNPVFVTKNANAQIAGRRVAWGKTHNCGQVCLSPDYAFVHSSKKDEFIQSFIANIKDFYPQGAKNSKDISRIVNHRHFQRIKGLLERTNGKIIFGGQTDETKLFIEPTLVLVDSLEDSLFSEEIFGPILPILVNDDLEDQFVKVRQIGDCPLAAYIFSDDKEEQQKILAATRSGGASINDCIMHAGISTLPFGGVGESGTGSYRGRYSVEAFVHRRTVISTPAWLEFALKMRVPPYNASKLKKIQGQNASPNFDRYGVVKSNPIKTLLFLGAGSFKAAVIRYAIAFIGWYTYVNKFRSKL